MLLNRLEFALPITLVLSTSPLATAQDLFQPKKLTPKEQAKVDEAPLGSAQNPVRCSGPQGERAYLKRLRCPSGEAPAFERSGSVGLGPYGTIMDRYQVRCPGSAEAKSVHMDMYHEAFVEKRAVSGFTIEEPASGAAAGTAALGALDEPARAWSHCQRGCPTRAPTRPRCGPERRVARRLGGDLPLRHGRDDLPGGARLLRS